jgi:hypothetical protein
MISLAVTCHPGATKGTNRILANHPAAPMTYLRFFIVFPWLS